MAADSGSRFYFVVNSLFSSAIPAELMQFLVRHRLILAFVALSFAALLFLWSSKQQEKAGKKQDQPPVPTTSPMADAIRFQYAVYYLPGSSSDAPAVFREVLAKEYPVLK